MDRLTLLFTLLLLGAANGHAQKFPSKGVPLISNYTPNDYGTAGKAWDIQSAANGIIYFATDQGLLEFDGHRWIKFKGSKGFTRSLFIESDSTFFTGADKDFGVWNRDDFAQFGFTSLNPFRESTKGLNEEFWGAYKIEQDYIFTSFDNIYVYKEEQLTKIGAPSRFYGSFASQDKVFLFDEKEGLFEFDGLSLKAVFNFPPNYSAPPKIVGVHQLAEGLLIVTRGHGIFLFKQGKLQQVENDVAPLLQKDQVFSFTAIDQTHFAFGTILNGVYVTDLDGKVIQHVNKQKGLLNNTILSLHYSQQGRLWLGMDFGIAAIDLWSDMTYFLDQQGQVGTGHTGLLYEGVFYLGTNQGLYYTDWDNLDNDGAAPDFNLVPGSSGQVWTLTVVDGKIMCGHDRGLFIVSNTTFQQLHDEAGVLAITQLPNDHLITGNYNGISLFQKANNRWSFVRKIPPVQGACSQVLLENNSTLWLNLPNFGLIKASLSENFQITEQRIFHSRNFSGALPQLFQDSSKIKAVTQEAIYTYQASSDTFIGYEPPHTAHPVANNIAGIHHQSSLNETYGFLPVHNGFGLKNTAYTGMPPALPPLTIRAIQAFNNDSVHLLSPGGKAPFRLNNVTFHYTVPHRDQVEYQYRLEDHTEGWSTWSSAQQTEALNLPAGRYTFHLKAKIGDKIIDQASAEFSISGPWHQTGWAYALYGFLILGVLYLNYLWQAYKLKQQKQKLQAKQKESQRLQEAAEEQNMLMKRYEMLEEALGEIKKQLRSKTIKLAKKAKENDEKSRILHALKEKVDAMEGPTPPSKFQVGQLSRILSNYPEEEDNSFSIQMEELQKDFLAKLGERYPDLTNYDLRLSAYLKSGLTTREIAELMNVLSSSVNVSRSRLRKKLQLEPKEDLYKFLNSIEVD